MKTKSSCEYACYGNDDWAYIFEITHDGLNIDVTLKLADLTANDVQKIFNSDETLRMASDYLSKHLLDHGKLRLLRITNLPRERERESLCAFSLK